jgi:hypothetical protein
MLNVALLNKNNTEITVVFVDELAKDPSEVQQVTVVVASVINAIVNEPCAAQKIP